MCECFGCLTLDITTLIKFAFTQKIILKALQSATEAETVLLSHIQKQLFVCVRMCVQWWNMWAQQYTKKKMFHK